MEIQYIDGYPVCPNCGKTMQKEYGDENENGDWSAWWDCDCGISDELLAVVNEED